MKPIQLTIAGLQSYREKQEIDFTRLCDAGVFGIFGPTGSGKSTILDAMTLALYGEVERASGGTQGILNHAEQTLSVSFTFELSSSAGWERYRVDRQYKRNGDTSLLQTVSRFVHLASGSGTSGGATIGLEGAQVLADKSKDVTKAVQDTLGLSMHDFTRAVVLPQGKFAEFLSLKDSERRQMLQRLFHLEAYGNQLNTRLSSRLKATDVALKQVAAEQQGLGDASVEALQAAASRLHVAKQAAAEQRGRLHALTLRRDSLKQRWDWQLERVELERELAQLAAREEAVALWERSLVLADAAERLLPFLREREETAQRSAAATRAQAAAAEGLAGATRIHEAAAEAQAAAQQALLAGEAGLSVRLERLRQALVLQQELQHLAAEVAQLLAAREQAAAALAAGTARLTKQSELRDRALRKQQELQAQLTRLEVPAEARHRLQAAALDKQQLAAAERQAAELAAEAAGAAQALERLRGQQRELGAREAALGAQLAADAAGAAGAREALRRLALEAGRLQAAVQAALAQLQRRQRERETARLSAHLAAALAEGAPCPVCGALEHPRLAAGGGHAPDREAREEASAAEAAAQLELLREPLQQLQFSLHQHAAKLDGLAALGSGSLPLGSAALAEAAAASAAPEPPDLLSLPETTPLLQAAAALQEQTSAAGGQVERIEQAVRVAQQQQRQQELQSQELAARMDAAQAAADIVNGKLSQAQKLLEGLLASWTEQYAGLTREQVDLERVRLAEQDKQTEELKERLAKSVPFLETTAKQIEQIHTENVKTDKELAQLEVQYNARRQAAAEKAVQMRALAEGDDVAALMQATESELNRIRSNERSTREQLNVRLAELQTTQQAFSTAVEASRSSVLAAERAEEAWQTALRTTIFTSQQEVEQARLLEDERTKRQGAIQLHREQETKLKLKLQSLDDRLQGELVTEEQWRDCTAEWNTAREKDEAALQEAAKAERDLEDTETKHVKWSELQRRRDELQAAIARMGKLQSVLRGNAFVEYVAEEQLTIVSRAASQRLGELTGHRYAIEVDSTGGFLIRDDANGGVKRPVSTLSGGETFLASLALALALSAQIQLRGKYPLEFFFLDEGFGTLDQDLLESVIAALEKLHMERLTVGVISHVPELKARLPRRLIVQPAAAAGEGSRVSVETG